LTPTAKTIQDIDDKKLDVAGGTMTGNLTIPDKIIHSGDSNTAIRFPSADTVTVETGGSERIRVDASGNLCVNTTQGISKFQVNSLADATSFFSVVGGDAIVAGNSVTVSKTQRGILHIDNNAKQSLGRNASLTFGLGGSRFLNTYYVVAGSIRTESLDTSNTNLNPKMVFSVLDGSSTTGTLVDRLEISHTGEVGIAKTPTAGIKLDVNGSIRASTGILFGTDTAADNTLGDYEQGTWTVELSAETPFTSITYDTVRSGKYTKIGNIVICHFTIRTDAISGGAGDVSISNLPFTVVNQFAFNGGGGTLFQSGNAGDFAGDVPSSISANINTTRAQLNYRATSNGNTAALDVSDLDTGADKNWMYGMIIYSTS
jgi:hypothetical protein